MKSLEKSLILFQGISKYALITQYSANSTENNSQNVEKFTKSSLQHQHLKSNEEIENPRQVPPPLKHPSSSTGDLLPGIDLDAVALMMQGGKGKLSNLIN